MERMILKGVVLIFLLLVVLAVVIHSMLEGVRVELKYQIQELENKLERLAARQEWEFKQARNDVRDDLVQIDRAVSDLRDAQLKEDARRITGQ